MSTEIEKAAAQALEQRPSYVPESTEGTEHITRQDIKLPRLVLAQSVSPQVLEGNAALIPGLKPGDFFNDLTQQIYGRVTLEFCIIRGDKPKYMEFTPREQGGGVIDANVPANDPRTLWTTGPDGKPVKPRATKIYDYVLVLLPSMEMLAFSLSSSGLKTATALNGLIAFRKAPIYMGKYSVTASVKAGPKGQYFAHVIKNAGWIPEAIMPAVKDMFERIKDQTLDIARDEDTTFDPEALENERGM